MIEKIVLLKLKNMKKRSILILLLLGSTSIIFSQEKVKDSAFNAMLSDLLSHSVKEIVPTDSSLTTKGVIFLDAREKPEFKVSRIENALWIGYDDFKLKRVKDISKDQKIVVYCSVGYRSEKIAERLEKAGYHDVSNLYGGIFEWTNCGNKIVNEKGETKKVHTFNKEWSQWLRKGEKIY